MWSTMIKNRSFSTDFASLQNGAIGFIKISFFIPFTTQLDSVDKKEPRNMLSRSIGSLLRDSGRASVRSSKEKGPHWVNGSEIDS